MTYLLSAAVRSCQEGFLNHRTLPYDLLPFDIKNSRKTSSGEKLPGLFCGCYWLTGKEKLTERAILRGMAEIGCRVSLSLLADSLQIMINRR